jgi:GNAT superfamily N-acetyltransferase
MKLTLAIAHSRADIMRSQALIAEIYNREYEVMFSDDHYDLVAKVEPWPHRYVMGTIDGELACAAGLYMHSTYVERFGLIEARDIRALRRAAGLPDADQPNREITKLVVNPKYRGLGLSRMILGAAHTRAFLDADGSKPNLLLCSKRSLVGSMHHREGIRPRTIRPFPIYKIHELYASPADPMDSYLILPEVDIPPSLYDRRIPGDYEIERSGGER